MLVLNNRDLSFVSWEQRFTAGDSLFPASQLLSDFSYARYAEILGLMGLRVYRPEDARRGLGGGAP